MSYVEPGDPGQLAATVRAAFQERYAAPATAVGRAPGRVNLIGEHTDYNAGLVLPVALPHATYAAWAPRTDGVLRVASRQQETVWEGRVDEIGPDTVDGWASYAAGVVWALREAGIDLAGGDLLVDGTVPLGAGLSSSAALECAVAVAVAPDVERRLLAAACIRAETEVAGAPTGGMDQYVALLAEPDHALLIDFASDETTQVPLELSGHTLLVTDTRVSHELTDGGYGSRRADCEEAARLLGVPTLREAALTAVETLEDERIRRRARHVVTEIERVTAVVDALGRSDWDTVGTLFLASHASMRDDFEISTPELDAAVAVAVEAGAVAARMTGGGFGGSSVALVPDERVEAAMRAIDATFVLEGFTPPAHLRAVPSAGATPV
ncbi:galactokinase [Nocardioides lianchengensis]|uniref:Galactokinase n=1 Tax=Nocardioides lianchengensis TaxID=1045774 RepID=A0A1G6SUE8_9ACTN|nr:galactokinase [Nocardioides lianchengensis]NYG09954.1 galactokinase [Nocardioides lianchengensis]SDD19817.1 galactokinase [Nocardioides lianchengensis]